jgi:hypothetical protein
LATGETVSARHIKIEHGHIRAKLSEESNRRITIVSLPMTCSLESREMIFIRPSRKIG